MTDVATTADILKFRKAAMTNAERQKAWRDRQRAKKAKTESVAPPHRKRKLQLPSEPVTAPQGSYSCLPSRPIIDVTPVTPVTRRSFDPARWVLRLASIALAAVGVSMNAVYAHSLGSGDLSGWLFLALGVAADASALVLPSVAASCQDVGSRAAAWAVWVALFAFALLGSVGFASTSISDVTMQRASRVTPAVTAAQAALADAQAARDRECKGGVGKFCRERETTVASARQNLETAMQSVAQTGDPQAAALVRVVTWISRGVIVPTEGDVGMIRLILMSLLPQVGGILLMASRSRSST